MSCARLRLLLLVLFFAVSFASADAEPVDPTSRAYQLALKGTKTLRPSRALVARCGAMLEKVGSAWPESRDWSIPFDKAPGEVLVQLSEGTDPRSLIQALQEDTGPIEVKSFRFGNLHTFKFSKDLAVPGLIRRVRRQPGVESASPNSLIGISRSMVLTKTSDGYTLTFTWGSGDCQAGCINKSSRTFTFDWAGRLTSDLTGGSGPGAHSPAPGSPGLGFLGPPKVGHIVPGPETQIEFSAPPRPSRR